MRGAQRGAPGFKGLPPPPSLQQQRPGNGAQRPRGCQAARQEQQSAGAPRARQPVGGPAEGEAPGAAVACPMEVDEGDLRAHRYAMPAQEPRCHVTPPPLHPASNNTNTNKRFTFLFLPVSLSQQCGLCSTVASIWREGGRQGGKEGEGGRE